MRFEFAKIFLVGSFLIRVKQKKKKEWMRQ